jgi:uncharacterized membrane protein YjgN (DUF898 family)
VAVVSPIVKVTGLVLTGAVVKVNNGDANAGAAVAAIMATISAAAVSSMIVRFIYYSLLLYSSNSYLGVAHKYYVVASTLTFDHGICQHQNPVF